MIFCGHKFDSHFPQYGDVQVIFQGATEIRINLKKLCGRKNKVRNYSYFAVTFPTIWRCARDFFKLH